MEFCYHTQRQRQQFKQTQTLGQFSVLAFALTQYHNAAPIAKVLQSKCPGLQWMPL